jgi:hypothetical protein
MKIFIGVFIFMFSLETSSQAIFSGEPVQVVGTMNGFNTSSSSNSTYRRLTVNSGNPIDGRGQWIKSYNVQATGGDFNPINMSGGGGGGFLFISGPSGNRFQNKWAFSGVGSAALNTINNISAFNSGDDMGLNMSTVGHYTFIFNDCGYTATNAKFYVCRTTNAPVNVSRSSFSLQSGGGANIGISTSATPSPEEKVFVTYRTLDANFENSGNTVVEASSSGTNWSASIGNQSIGAVVYYYIFTSTLSLSTLNSLSAIDLLLAALRYDDNNGSEFSYIASTLPVTFTSLTGTIRNGRANLNWNIADEHNVDRYEVEESANGRQFQSFIQVDAASRSSYQAIDAQLHTGANYYRVKAVDIDGKLTYSKIIRLDNNSAVDNDIRVYPNPSRGELNLGLNIPAGNYQIRLINSMGQTVYQQPLTHEGGSRSMQLGLPKLSSGVYQVEVRGGVQKYVRSIRID